MNLRVGIIGYGSMGKMILEKIIESKIVPITNMYISNRTYNKIQLLSSTYKEIHMCQTNSELLKQIDIVFVCVKPFDIKSVLIEIEGSTNKSAYVISLNASVLFEQMEKICTNRKISKIIPSVTAEVNQSQTLVCHNKYVTSEDRQVLNTLIGTFGTGIEINEAELGIGSELTSCMPGFIAAIFKEICIEAKKHTEISVKQIYEMVLSTLLGTSEYMLATKATFDEVIGRVATKGGITEEGVKILHEEFQETIKHVFEKTLEKRMLTTKKSQEQFNNN